MLACVCVSAIRCDGRCVAHFGAGYEQGGREPILRSSSPQIRRHQSSLNMTQQNSQGTDHTEVTPAPRPSITSRHMKESYHRSRACCCLTFGLILSILGNGGVCEVDLVCVLHLTPHLCVRGRAKGTLRQRHWMGNGKKRGLDRWVLLLSLSPLSS